MHPTITIHTTTFTEEEISIRDENGVVCEYADIPYDDDHTSTTIETFDAEFFGGEPYETVTEWAVRIIRQEGLTFEATGSDWAANPDGSTIVDYMAGEREEVSAHLSGFTEWQESTIHTVVG